jgi:mono/diheme cytochrome c family protein
MNSINKWLLSICACACFACDSTTPPDEAGANENPFDAQVARGADLYTTHCADCHGADGRGTDQAPAVVGLEDGALPLEPREGAVRDTQFKTVGDVAAFVAANMPPTNPGGLQVDEYYAILAFDLHANGIDLEEELTAALAEELVIPR